MKSYLMRALACLTVLFTLYLQPVFSQSTATFDVETSTDEHYMIQSLALPGNSVGVLKLVNGSDVFLSVYNGSGTLTKDINITSQINWQHTYHYNVALKATATTDGKIFLVYAANSNSYGFQTFNARYVLLSENGLALASGQLNNVNVTDYIFNLEVDRLSDGKIVALWKRGNSTACFRIFNADGTPFATEKAFAGDGTNVPVYYLYQVRMAAGKAGNFMVSLYNSNGYMRGFMFDNNGNNAISGGALSFTIDPSVINNYYNSGLAALSNGNFVQSWYLSGVIYLAIFSKDGGVVKAKYPSGLPSPQHFLPVYDASNEGFIQTELVAQGNGMDDPNRMLIVHRFDNNGVLKSSTPNAEGNLIQPEYYFVQGTTSGYAYTYSYYRSYSVESMPWDPPGMGMVMLEGDRDTKAATRMFATPALSTLPVDLERFTANLLINQQVQLKWATASESQNSHFEVQKSIDGTHFKTIGKVVAAGVQGQGAEYQFTDVASITTKTYYRLRQYDTDGRSKLLGVRMVHPSGVKVQTTVYPNPVKGNTITITAGSEALPLNWRLVDGSGRKINEGVLQQRSQQVSVQGLLPGVYYLKVGKEVLKLIK